MTHVWCLLSKYPIENMGPNHWWAGIIWCLSSSFYSMVWFCNEIFYSFVQLNCFWISVTSANMDPPGTASPQTTAKILSNGASMDQDYFFPNSGLNSGREVTSATNNIARHRSFFCFVILASWTFGEITSSFLSEVADLQNRKHRWTSAGIRPAFFPPRRVPYYGIRIQWSFTIKIKMCVCFMSVKKLCLRDPGRSHPFRG